MGICCPVMQKVRSYGRRHRYHRGSSPEFEARFEDNSHTGAQGKLSRIAMRGLNTLASDKTIDFMSHVQENYPDIFFAGWEFRIIDDVVTVIHCGQRPTYDNSRKTFICRGFWCRDSDIHLDMAVVEKMVQSFAALEDCAFLSRVANDSASVERANNLELS